MIDPEYVSVTAAVIEKDGKVLMARRKHSFMGYSWEFPGGKLEDNETLEECLKGRSGKSFPSRLWLDLLSL